MCIYIELYYIIYIYIYEYMYTSVLLSLYSDISAAGKEFCGTWQLLWRS